MAAKSKELLFIDVARIFACIAVVSIHSVGLSTVLLSQGPTASWWSKTIVTSFSVWAVPVFVMISGALLLSPSNEESVKDFFAKRFWRVGIPAMVWIPLYFVVDHFYRGDSLNPAYVVHRLVFSSYDHLYFLVLIVQLYLLTPFLRVVVKKSSQKSLLTLISLFFLVAIFWKKSSFVGTMFVPFIGYYLLGAYLVKEKLSKALTPLWVGMFGGAGCFITLLTFLASKKDELTYIQDTFYYSHNKPLVILLSVSSFLIIQNSAVTEFLQSHVSVDTLKKFAQASFGVYILHPLVQYSALSVIKLFVNIQPLQWWMLLLFIPFTLGCSYHITKMFLRTKVLKDLV